MDDTAHMVRDMAERLFAEIANSAPHRRTDASVDAMSGWSRVVELGLPLALVADEASGLGLTAAEALGIVRIAGRHALALPLADTMLANRVLTDAGLAVADGVATLAEGPGLSLQRTGTGWSLTGEARRVPWGGVAGTIAVVASGPDGPYVARVDGGDHAAVPGLNLADEPRDDLRFDLALPADAVGLAATRPGARALGALVRAGAMAGAMERALEITVGYAGERVQFGKPIGRFQAVQQSLAVMAGQVAAASAAADLAADALGRDDDGLPIAVAKARVGEAAGAVAVIAHQVHGAIGFTREHALHQLTRRLWAWRDEFGGETEWNLVVGRRAAEAGPDGLWPLIAAAA